MKDKVVSSSHAHQAESSREPGTGLQPSARKVLLCDASSRLAMPHFRIQDTGNVTLYSTFSTTSSETK